jgi:hypothetical protein
LEITPELVGQLVSAAVVSVWALYTWSSIRGDKREVEGRCPRCGAAAPASSVGGVPYCVRCAETTKATTTLGFRLFLGMALFAATLMSLFILNDIRRGYPLDRDGVVTMFGWTVLGPLAVAFWIRWQAGRGPGSLDD